MKIGSKSSRTALFLWGKLAIRYNRVPYTPRLAIVWQCKGGMRYTNESSRVIMPMLEVLASENNYIARSFILSFGICGFNGRKDSHCGLLDYYTVFFR
jgi:hypothetical protein